MNSHKQPRFSRAGRAGLAAGILLLLLAGCGGSSQVGDTPAAEGSNPTATRPQPTSAPVVRATRTLEGDSADEPAATRAPDPATGDGSAAIVPIGELEPFSDEASGISGLRPRNWLFAAQSGGVAIMMRLGQRTGFGASILPADQLPPGSQQEQIKWLVDQTRAGERPGFTSELLEQTSDEDGGATIVISSSGTPQGSSTPVSLVSYMRLVPTPKGILAIVAELPEQLYRDQTAEISQIVDSIRIE